jgi:hypothetical protein
LFGTNKGVAVFTRIAVALVAALTVVLGVSAATANATPHQPDCTIVLFDSGLSEGVEAFCGNAPGVYQVVARCTNDVETWQAAGTLAEAGTGPSVAECRGLLLFPARVLDYFVIQ